MMQFQKTWIITVILAVLLSGMAFAATSIQEKDADFLNNLGLFEGTGNGYALDRTLTRAEGAVMLTRLLGGEQEALADSEYTAPFTDVPDWAKPYINWLYENKLTNGTSSTTYSPKAEMKFEEYTWFLGRAAGYTDTEVSEGKTVISAASYTKYKNTKINRGQAAALSMDTLYHSLSGSEETLASQLIQQNVFTLNQWDAVKVKFEDMKQDAATEGLKGSTWEYQWDTDGYSVYRRANGKFVAKSQIKGSICNISFGKDGIFMRRYSELYYLDPKTLAAKKIMDLPQYCKNSDYTSDASVVAKQGNLFLISVHNADDKGSLYTWSLADGLKEAKIISLDAEMDVLQQYAQTESGLVAFEASGKVKILYDQSCADTKQVGDAIYYIPYVPYQEMAEFEGVWHNLSSVGGLKVVRYENGCNQTVMELTTNKPFRLETIYAIDGDTVEVQTLVSLYMGSSDMADYILYLKNKDGKAQVVSCSGGIYYPTERLLEHPTRHTEAEVIAWWNEQLSGTSDAPYESEGD